MILSRTLPESNFAIPFFLDGSSFETCTPGTGPNGNDAHSMRTDAYITQRSVYSGYKKIHGLTVLSKDSRWNQLYLRSMFCLST